jgi:hypothetical protein
MLIGHQEFKGATPDVVPCKRKWEIQDGGRQTGSKQLVLIYQLPDQIATPFQRLTHHFRGPATQWQRREYCPTQPEIGF